MKWFAPVLLSGSLMVEPLHSPKHQALLQSLGAPMVKPAFVTPPTPPPKTIGVMPFLYSGTNKFYMIQWSSDLVGWTPIPELMNCILPASTNSDLVVTNTEPKRFYRAVGHDDFYMYAIPQ